MIHWARAIAAEEAQGARERLLRYDATIHGLLYIAGLLHSAQPIGFFMHDVMREDGPLAMQIARRYLRLLSNTSPMPMAI